MDLLIHLESFLMKRINILGGVIVLTRANNKGWRIDYILVSNSLDDKLINANIFSDTYQSDHCPIGIDLNLF